MSVWKVLSSLVVLISALSCGTAPPEIPDIAGTWEGEILFPGAELIITARLSYGEDGILSGTMDIPQQQARDLLLTDLSQSGDSTRFALTVGYSRGDFTGVVSGDSITGLFEQGGYAGTFELVRVSLDVETVSTSGEEVTIAGEDCVLAGTLTLPEVDPPYPCVFFLSGSGLQDRDEYVMGFTVFADLADHLVSQGIAVLRCDDRGMGGSTGGMHSFSDSVLMYDAGLMLDHLRADGRIDPGRIGVLGHSEGSNIAFMLAAQRPDDIAFIVSMAGPAVDGYHLIPDQMEVILGMQGFTEEEIAAKREAQIMIMDAVIAGGDMVLVDSILRDQMEAELAALPEEQLAMIGDMETYIDQTVAQNLASIDNPWFYNFLTHDPSEAAQLVRCPVLALYGGLDIQVTDEANHAAMVEALSGNPDHEVKLFPEANHLFQLAGTGSVEEYALLEPAFIDGFLETVSGWIVDKVY